MRHDTVRNNPWRLNANLASGFVVTVALNVFRLLKTFRAEKSQRRRLSSRN
jgi:hypothetical protein